MINMSDRVHCSDMVDRVSSSCLSVVSPILTKAIDGSSGCDVSCNEGKGFGVG